MDLESIRETVPMVRQHLEKAMLDRNYVQLERDTIQQFFDITKREVKEMELAIQAKDREMEMLEDNHRVELRVYQQKVKHLEYENRLNVKTIISDGTQLLEGEQTSHQEREKDLLRRKEQLKFEEMEVELVNASKVADMRQQQDKQMAKLRSQFEDSLSELVTRCEGRLNVMARDLELRRRVEVHEVEERKNQHINDLIKNHKKAFGNMKEYYNDITSGNLQLIKSLQKQVAEFKVQASNNRKMLSDYDQENLKLSEPLSKVSAEITDLQVNLKERTKDQMALRNAKSRLSEIQHNVTEIRGKLKKLEEQYSSIEMERDDLYNSFEDGIRTVQQQSEFSNQVLEQRLVAAESNVEKAANQVEEIMRAANLDQGEMGRVIASLNQMLAAKDDALHDVQFLVAKLKKAYNDTLLSITLKLVELGVPNEEIESLGFTYEDMPNGGTDASANLVTKF